MVTNEVEMTPIQLAEEMVKHSVCIAFDPIFDNPDKHFIAVCQGCYENVGCPGMSWGDSGYLRGKPYCHYLNGIEVRSPQLWTDALVVLALKTGEDW